VPHDASLGYCGELSEFDVLGISRDQSASEQEIQQALKNAKPIRLQPGSAVLLIQSGAAFPDDAMVTGLGKELRVVPFSGVPEWRRDSSGALLRESSDPGHYSRSLRLTAARAGCDFVVCYWGMLESESQDLPTKTVSWVPVVNWLLPDEKQHMRIRLKVAVMDIRSGDWSIFSPAASAEGRISTRPTRGMADQKQVERLKADAYEAAIRELVARHLQVAESR
jgi:hypothetical protein